MHATTADGSAPTIPVIGHAATTVLHGLRRYLLDVNRCKSVELPSQFLKACALMISKPLPSCACAPQWYECHDQHTCSAGASYILRQQYACEHSS